VDDAASKPVETCESGIQPQKVTFAKALSNAAAI
jgi:hypothetical protein